VCSPPPCPAARHRSDTIFAVKAPSGTTLEVPEPELHQTEDGGITQRFRVLLHSTAEPVEVFLVQHVPHPGEAAAAAAAADGEAHGEAEQAALDGAAAAAAAAAGDGAKAEQQGGAQQEFMQEAPAVAGSQQHAAQQAPAQQHEQCPEQAADAAPHDGPGDISMEPPAPGSDAAAAAAATAAALAAAAAAAAAGASDRQADAGRRAASASPISKLAQAIGAGGVSAADIPVPAPPGFAGALPKPGGRAPVAAGLSSPVFPPPGGALTSPGLGAGCASPAAPGWRPNEIDADAWFEGDGGAALGGLGDLFKADAAIFNQQAAAPADQAEGEMVAAW
jgi:transcription factor E2F3